MSSPIAVSDHDYLGERKQSLRRLRWKLCVGSVFMAILVFVFRDQLVSLAEAFREFYQTNQ